MIDDLLFRLRALVSRSAADHELDEELRFHVEQQAAKYRAQGVGAEEAARRARLDLGGAAQVKDECRDSWGVRAAEALAQDVRYALRTLGRSPGFTLCAVMTLALGIGANTAIFTVINRVLLSPLPYPRPEELVAALRNDSQTNLLDIERQAHSFAQGGGINIAPIDYTGGPEPVQIRAGFVTAGLFPTLGAAPLLGRLMAPSEDVSGGPHYVVVSYEFWQNFLSHDGQVIGRTVTLGGSDYTVIGVLPGSFALPREKADVFLSVWVANPGAERNRGLHFLHTYWRLKPGVSIGQAQAELAAIDQQLIKEHPETEKARRTVIRPLHELLVGKIRTALLVLFGAVGLVLLIACANFAMLLTARGLARRRELTIRTALGAGSGRLLRQTLTESTLLSLAGGALGLLLALWGTRLLLGLKPAALDRFEGVPMDARVFVFVLAVSVGTGIVFGMASTWAAARGDVAESLKENARSTTAGSTNRGLQRWLISAEFALALVLLVGAGLLIKGYGRLRAVDAGFAPENLTTMHVELPVARYKAIEAQTNFRRALQERLDAMAGVEAAMITDLPLGGNYVGHGIVIDGHPPITPGAEPEVQTLSVMGPYFHVMQIPLRAGRAFTPEDREGEPLVAIVNEQFVRTLLPNQNPLGVRVDWSRREGPHKWMTIVGVAADVKHLGLNQPVDAAIYAPYAQTDEPWRRWMTVVLRTRTGTEAALVAEVKKQVWSIDGQVPVGDVHSMTDLMADSIAQEKFNMLLLGLFAALAMVLASVGVYGLVAYRVGQRLHEIAIRMSLGAQPRQVMALAVSDGARLALIGIAIGIPGALAVTRVMSSLLFEVKPTDPATFVLVSVALAVVAVAAAAVPARRAMRVDPAAALRNE